MSRTMMLLSGIMERAGGEMDIFKRTRDVSLHS
jgi:hypothetical protein